MLECRIIKSPSPGTLDILLRRKGSAVTKEITQYDAIGLVQGRLIDMLVAADIAEKAAGVVVEDIKGNCPQNLILIAVFGDTASVEAALADIQRVINVRRAGDVQ